MLSPQRDMYERLGPVVRQDTGLFSILNLFGPDACQMVLSDRQGIFSARLPWTWIMGRIFPNGLLLRDGEDHRHHRRIMQQAFRRPALGTYLERMNPRIEEGVASWGQRPDLRAFLAFKKLTLDLAASIFLGEPLGPQTDHSNHAFEDMVAASMSQIRLNLPGLEFSRGLKGRAFMAGFISGLIEKKRTGGGDDMFSLLCRAEDEDGRRLSDQEITDHMIFLMMAAHDTTTSTLSSLTYELARHPEWQERVREEARALGRPWLDLDDVDALESLTWVMKETMRRYPPLPVIPRVATEGFEWAGYEIPKGSMLTVSPIHTHHMSEWWTDPFTFDPARFSPARDEAARHPFMWIPFGGGVHHCLGFRFAEIQIKAIVHQLVLRFRWRVPEGYRMPVQQAPISKPRDGLPITFEPLRPA